MKPLIRLALVSVLLAAAVLLAVPSFAQDTNTGTPTYRDVKKDIAKHIGTRASWIGSPYGYSKTADGKEQIYTFFWQNEDGNCFGDHTFGVRSQALRQTAAAAEADKDPYNSLRVVSGTVDGSQDLTLTSGNMVTAVMLQDATIDVVPGSESQSHRVRQIRGLLTLASFLGPCVLAGWIGCRLLQPLSAFVAAWVLTPLLTVALFIVIFPVLRAFTPPNDDGTWAIMIPIYSMGTGLVTGVVTAVICARRGRPATANLAETASTATVETSAAPDRRDM